MQFIMGILVTLVVLLVAVMWWMHSNVKKTYENILAECRQLNHILATMPKAVTNIIHLGLKDSRMTTGLVPASLSIRPEDFAVNADKLYANLVKGLTERVNHNLGIRAFCIIKDAGVREMVSTTSANEAEQALTRLLNNGDEDATKRFLRTLADSVCQPSVEEAAH